MTTALRSVKCSSLGEGALSLVLKFGDNLTPIELRHVQYVPDISDVVISCQEFNEQLNSFLYWILITDTFILGYGQER